MNVVLFTSEGDGNFVHRQEIPEFSAPPDVLFWGERVFIARRNYQGAIVLGVDGFVYEEAFWYRLTHVPERCAEDVEALTPVELN